jgi:hypothetical protein
MSHHLVRSQKQPLLVGVSQRPAQELERWSKQHPVRSTLLMVCFGMGVLLMAPLIDILVGQSVAFLCVCMQTGAATGALWLCHKNNIKIKHRNT